MAKIAEALNVSQPGRALDVPEQLPLRRPEVEPDQPSVVTRG